ncbi:hypothetical protein KIH39_25980 [Telmatocola sphagniphila]|jgi:hypothetical protein|uniref:Uncharacterized protein n=1 Tax=Telmatocola sphagniphila TaxID=1123043 RepID=A0A8E6B6U7_9BACT|nr:hypothetical protein [Telmatocola sphagniphila]QVL32241.1 hypothetical protein KIH39_25980 [Telmatocola sphagniphila]
MDAPVIALPTESKLEEYVREVLCQRDNLDPRQSALYRSTITRHGRECGWMFHLKGVRAMRNSAIFAESENRILFYDSTGKKFHEVKLSECPSVEALSKAA